MDDDASRKRAVARTFGAAAPGYLDSDAHRAGWELDRIAAWCAGADRALDVATGAGHTAAAIAEAGVSEVVALDAAPSMLATAAGAVTGVAWCLGDAERLPFATASFDAVACRIAAHHFPSPRSFVDEVARVLRPGGTLAFCDNVAPDDAAIGGFLNRLEAARDHSHVESHTVATWRSWLRAARFSIMETEAFAKRLTFEPWVDRIDPADRDDADRIARLLAEADESIATALDVRIEGGRVESFLSPKILIRALMAD